MLKKILLLLVVAVAVFLGVASQQPDEFRVSRSITINAPAEKIFALVNNPKQMQLWSPWTSLDPNGTFTFEGPEAGVGAISKWSGNSDLGEGQATITESRASEYVKTQLDFFRPMEGTNTAEFTLAPKDGGIEVTWTMYGPQTLFSKAIGLLFNCKAMVSDMFDKGLGSLKSMAEQP